MSRMIVFVGDVPRCTAFYRDVLGLTPIDSDDADVWQELDAGGCKLALHQAYSPDGPIKQPTGSEMNPHKIVFYVDDIESTRQTLIDRGVAMTGITRNGATSICDGSDPEGHRFQICDRPETVRRICC